VSANVARANTRRRDPGRLSLRLGRRFGRTTRGQVLLVAVMVLFGVAALAALFVGIIGSQMVQVTRYTDVAALRAVAEAGLRLANHDLVYGVRGADWRPRATPLQVGRGQVLVRVTYGPTPDDLQSRYLVISATATFRDNPFVSYTILGVKPLLLTDYARCITDRYELRQPAALGVTGVEDPLGGSRADYLFSVTGPVFSNTDLVWYGESQVNLATPSQVIGPHLVTWRELGILRDDRVEVAGQMRSPAWADGNLPADAPRQANPLHLFVSGASYASNVFLPQTADEQYRYQNGFVDLKNGLPVVNSWRVLADLPTYRPSLRDPFVDRTLIGGAFAVPRVQPPRMDALEPDLHTNRYLTLTRDSGIWQQIGAGATAAYVNTGAWGWGWAYGGGLYLDNDQDLQYVDPQGNHDLEALRRNWMAGAPGSGKDGRAADPSVSDWWDKTGRYYAPPGAEIVLHGEAACPYLEIIRRDIRSTKDADGSDVYYVWKDPTGAAIPAAAGSLYRYATDAAGMWCRPSGGTGAPPFGVDTDGVRAIFPFPPNGVIYAEGNVRIRGLMPANRNASAAMRYLPSDHSQAGASGWSRRYDLQVVSGGTIYVEGDLLSPAAAKLYTPELGTSPAIVDVVSWDQLKGSRVALIARDSVCVNTTAFHPRPINLYTRDASGACVADSFNDSQPLYPNPSKGFPSQMHFTVTEDGDPRDGPIPTEPDHLDFRYTNVRFDAAALAADLIPDYLKLTIGHSAWYTATPGTDPATLPPSEAKDAKVRLQVDVNGQTMPWRPDGSLLYYEFQVSDQPPPAPPIGVSYHWFQENMWYTDPANRSPFLPFNTLTNDYQETISRFGDFQGSANWTYFVTGNDAFRLTPTLYPVTTHPTDGSPPQWIVKPTQLGYVLGPLAVMPKRDKTPLPVRIEALVYAQNGSWFVLPGPWFNENPADRPQDAAALADIVANPANHPYPVYHEPLNLQIQFYGAIAENMPASPGDVAVWTSRWAGLITSSQFANDHRSLGITYEYDPLLRQPRLEDLGACPRFPNLPLSPDLLIWGERVAGFSTAGV